MYNVLVDRSGRKMGYVSHNCDVVEVLYGICAVLMWLRHRDDAKESPYIAEITENWLAGVQPNASAVIKRVV